MISWTDEAVEGARSAYAEALEATDISVEKCMRAALDAAVRAQSVRKSDVITLARYNATYNEGYVDGRAEALEEAAKVADRTAKDFRAYRDHFPHAEGAETAAAAIRSLKDKTTKPPKES